MAAKLPRQAKSKGVGGHAGRDRRQAATDTGAAGWLSSCQLVEQGTGWRLRGDGRTFFMNLRATRRISSLMVAENIMTCFLVGHFRNTFWTTCRMSAHMAVTQLQL